jgi:DNA-binding beta-propeller fold protein YncE
MKNSNRPPITFLSAALALVAIPQLEVHAGILTLVAGGGASTADKVKATEAQLNTPFGVEFDKAGNLYFVELNGHRVCRVDAKGVLTTVAGTGKKGDAGDGGPALEAQFNGMHNLAIAPNDDLLLADTWNNRVRKIDARTQLVSTIAGTGERGFSGDGGPATQATFGNIYCASLDPQAQQLYLADLDNRRIRAVDLKTGIVKTVAGNGATGAPKDGAVAVNAPLLDPRAVAVNAKGEIYILERTGNALRVVGRDGKIRTVAGTGAKGADGGNALEATLNGPKHLCFDLEGNVLIADSENHLIRKYLPASGKIVRVAGNGQKGTNGLNGPPEQAELNQPHGVTVHRDGTLFIADSSNGRVLKIAR